MFEDVIKLLLEKKATLREELEREFAERAQKIDNLLDACGYVEPVAEVVEATAEEIADVEPAEATETQVIY